MGEKQDIVYRTETPRVAWFTETVTLAEHQLLKRVRQLCHQGGTTVLLEIISRHELSVIETDGTE